MATAYISGVFRITLDVFSGRGMDWDTQVHGKGSTVKSLLVDLYQKAGDMRNWDLIRMISGMLRKKVEELDWVKIYMHTCRKPFKFYIF